VRLSTPSSSKASTVSWSEGGPSLARIAAAAVLLAAAFAVSATSFAFALRSTRIGRSNEFALRTRRLAYLAIAVPPLYVFSGVLYAVLGKPLSQEWAWCVVWLAAGVWTALGSEAPVLARPAPTLGNLRVAHGIGAALILVFILFHLANHLFALAGPEAHTAIQAAGDKVYRAPAVEPILVGLLLFQVVSGFSLAWRWSALPGDVFRVFQIASGVYLGFFILVHMDSVFLFARLYLEIPTDWAFMTGEPEGLIHGYIHLVPHYALGVFFVLSHLAGGLRNVVLAHGVARPQADRLWAAALVVNVLTATAIIFGMTGLRLGSG
jgi:hypothetical protein